MFSARAPAGPRPGFVRRNGHPSHGWQSADDSRASQSDANSRATRAEDLRNIPIEPAMLWPFAHRIMEGFPKLDKSYDSQIASWKIVTRMQVGSSGTVFKCVNAANGQEEVVKVIPKSPLKKLKQVTDIWKEIVLLQKLEHPNIVACNGARQTDTNILIFMDFAGPRNLRTYLKNSNGATANNEPMAIPTRVSITGQILAGLAHCHANGVAHRDLKPENIVVMFIDGSMRARIVDFGLATESTKSCTDFVGTIPFIAPEVAVRFEHEQYDPACADMWSCGVVLLEVLCGVGKINRMVQWRRFPESRLKYRDDLEHFFSIKNRLTASVEAEVGQVGSASFPGKVSVSLSEMLTPDPSCRCNATKAIETLLHDTRLAATTACV